MTTQTNWSRFDRTNAIIAIMVWLFSFVVYFLTKAPTVSFWDCGEFIAACSILGIPHPPGTPLYIMIGRVMSILPLSPDVGVRVNMLSVLGSSFSALFGYLVVVRILRSWFGQDESSFARMLIYGGAISGAMFMAFSLTNWNNSVEAEVYGLSMALMMAMVWLVLIYLEKKGTALGNRVMLLIVYIGFAGIGVHLTTILMLPVLSLFFIIKKDVPTKIWYLLASFFVAEMYLVFALSSRPDEIPFYLPVAIVFVIYLFFIFSFESIPRLHLFIAGGFALAIAPLYGYAVEAFRGGAGVLSVATIDNLSLLGQASLGGLTLFGLYLLARSWLDRKKQLSKHNLYAAIFVIAAILAVAALEIPKGYDVFLFISGLIVLVLAVLIWKHINWTIMIAMLSVIMVMLGVKEHFVGMGAAALLIVILGVLFRFSGWKQALLIILVAVLGYSVHVYIPIRSAEKPAINENDPAQSQEATINYLERKQYGSQSMTSRMFKRRAEWSNQFGISERMGFWSFFSKQYGINGSKFVVLFLLGVFGIWELIRRKPRIGLAFLVMLLIASVGLILYMNFADGTRQHPTTGADYMEVRDRDYFFTPAFILFGLAMGMGAAILIQFLRDSITGMSPALKKGISFAAMAIFLTPTFALAGNYYLCDRSRNYIPYDYAWNLLTSSEENAILFTGGDNDTFPIWCLQEAYHIRTDVKLINMSLSNTKWYIKQIQNTLGVTLGWSEEQIDSLRPYRIPDGTVFRLQDQVINAVIANNYGKRPINFSVTTSSGSRKIQGKRMDSLLTLKGMVWSLDKENTATRIDRETSFEFYMNPEKFVCRGVNDKTIFKDDATTRLTRNYTNGMIMVANNFRQHGDFESAERLISMAIEKIPHAPDGINFLASLYAQQGKTDELHELMNRGLEIDNRRLRLALEKAHLKKGEIDQAESILNQLLAEDPTYRPAFEELSRLYYRQDQVGEMRALFKKWLLYNPTDKRIRDLLVELEREAARVRSNDTTEPTQ